MFWLVVLFLGLALGQDDSQGTTGTVTETVTASTTTPDVVTGCPDFQEVHPESPLNSSVAFNFPNDTSVLFPEKKKCSWMIHIPSNHFAILYVNATIPSGGSITVDQAPNHTERFLESHMEVALVFVFPSVGIYWDPGNSSLGDLQFNVQWQEFPVNMSTKSYTLEKQGRSTVLDHEDTYSPVTFEAASKVSIFCLPGHRREEDTYLRTIVVFDGPDVHSPYLGSLFSIHQSRSQLVSSNSTATIFSIVPIPTSHHIIVQDASMYQDVKQISGLSMEGSDVEKVKMEATDGKSVIFTLIDSTLQDEYLIGVELEHGAELQVYFEGLSDTQKVATYTNKNNRTHLPQKLQGRVRYYVLTAGNASLTLTRDKWKADWETAFAGRRGFFSSKFWRHDENELGLQQDSFHFIGKESKNATEFRFSYRVLEADTSGDGNLHIVVSDNVRRIHYYDHRSASEYSNETEWFTHLGHSISLVYSSNYRRSEGFFAEFQIDSASRFPLLSIFTFVFCFWTV